MIPLCGYILQGGKRCEQAAIKGEVYCRHHLFVRQAIASAAPQDGNQYGERAPLPFVFPEDRAAVQINYFLVLQAINAGRLDLKTAAMMIRLLKACDANLKKGSLNEGADAGEAESEPETEGAIQPVSEEAVSEEGISVHAAGVPAGISGESRNAVKELDHSEMKPRFKGKRRRHGRRGRR